MRVLVITPPAAVVSLADAKEHLRIDTSDEDALIAAKVAAATAHIDGPDSWLGRALGVQTLEAEFDGFACLPDLPLPPIIDVVSVAYLDTNREVQTVDPADYELYGRRLVPAEGVTWPTVYSGAHAAQIPLVRVRYRAGYVEDPLADPLVTALPEPIKAAILLMTGDLYANRETAVTGTVAADIPMSTTVERLLAPFRLYA